MTIRSSLPVRLLRAGARATRTFYRRTIKSRLQQRVLKRSSKLDSIDPARPVYVFFAPEGGIRAHFNAHYIVANALRELGHQVLMVSCFDAYRYCLVKEMNLVPVGASRQRNLESCLACAQSGHDVASPYNFPTVQLSDLLDEGDYAGVKTQVAEMPADATDFEIEGVRFGALCGADVALNTKKIEQLKVTGKDRKLLEAYVEASLTSYRATQALNIRYKIGGLIFFNEYSIFMGAVAAAQRAGIPIKRISYAIHRNIDVSKIIIMSEPLAVTYYHRCLDEWSQWRVLALPPKTVEMITDSNLSRFGAGGFSVYSPKFTGSGDDLYGKLSLSSERKLLVAFTSSVDEYYSNINLMAAVGVDLFQKEQPFANQIIWLTELLQYVESSSDLQLVVRIHPREGLNARESIISEHLEMLRARFSGKYRHVRIVWPEETISSYDLGTLADLVLTSWTSITMEMARIGVPTIAAFKRINPVPVDDVVGWAPTPESYFRLLKNTLNAPMDPATIRYAYRWTHVSFLASYVDVAEAVGSRDNGMVAIPAPASVALIERAVVEGVSLQSLKLQELRANQSSAADEAEWAEILRQLRRTLWFLATGEDRVDDYRLGYGPGVSLNNCDAVVTVSGDAVEFRTAQHVVNRRSRAIERLSALTAQVRANAGQPAMVS